ncbi:MAG: Unknown protein [uncultured Sulfurovum sp.]|uniref:Uncharacterized protein n=1 Tax=uncultured Sulfurovum sp. TaxID=269237 RepID=A0A6S6TBN1_9BACT|nr:MAG: Unknown protein [uncultured Sulfurovum sp.]
MVKFILIVITIVFVGLAYYVNIDKDKSTIKTVVKKEVSTPPIEEPLVEVKKEVSQQVTQLKQDTSTNKEAPVKELIPSVEDSKEIDTTELEIDQEYHPNVNRTSDEPLSDKELDAIEKHMIASGEISQEDDFSASTENLGYDPSELAR